MNLARSGAGEAPTLKSCNKKWREKIDESGIEHDTFVILDDRDHKKGNLHAFITAPINGIPSPAFPIVFVLDHNGRVVNKNFQGFTLSAATDAVKKLEKSYDEALEEAKSSKKDSKDEEASSEDEDKS